MPDPKIRIFDLGRKKADVDDFPLSVHLVSVHKLMEDEAYLLRNKRVTFLNKKQGIIFASNFVIYLNLYLLIH